MINQIALDNEVKRLLDILYEKRFEKLNEIKLSRLLKKNPYLFRSVGIINCSDLIDAQLDAFLSSSDETIFGNDFFEPLALWTATNAEFQDPRIVTVGSASGTDLSIETSDSYLAIAVKSGTNIFNSQSTKGQSTEFLELQSRLRKLKKEIRTIIGYGYGRNKASKKSTKEKYAGQAFWYLLSGEEDFYLRISDSIGKSAIEHRQEYLESYNKTKNRLLKHLMVNFVEDNGELNWHKIVEYNSSIEKPEKIKESNEE
ncbi:PmeII family type II restriction endonuclease [Kangiella japonica]|uniref:PmeII family type II restriction endonuclease n=1 Tax=Kangiella japonica TaxID=647384 RepID=A0ABN0T239_9GAMM